MPRPAWQEEWRVRSDRALFSSKCRRKAAPRRRSALSWGWDGWEKLRTWKEQRFRLELYIVPFMLIIANCDMKMLTARTLASVRRERHFDLQFFEKESAPGCRRIGLVICLDRSICTTVYWVVDRIFSRPTNLSSWLNYISITQRRTHQHTKERYESLQSDRSKSPIEVYCTISSRSGFAWRTQHDWSRTRTVKLNSPTWSETRHVILLPVPQDLTWPLESLTYDDESYQTSKMKWKIGWTRDEVWKPQWIPSLGFS